MGVIVPFAIPRAPGDASRVRKPPRAVGEGETGEAIIGEATTGEIVILQVIQRVRAQVPELPAGGSHGPAPTSGSL
ncbi:hypothetical protein FHS55_000367 [Angulomicrobium tetraedrale]|uniref:Uncharacterized protein n=1 Tax=Ancylobacter tetraedralis TaxID=217068 RepID=A0A839Z4D8_9HYPH|nr:hypothetical protein [Ancylobacter tetraedralis]MBB3769781.1 hypothetical protein [Ancylobacter tetraedralis]